MPKLKVGFPIYENFDSLDVLGPLQAFFYAGFECHLIAETCEPVQSLEGVWIRPDSTFGPPDSQMDVIMVPGASDVTAVMNKGHAGDNLYLDFLIRQEPDAVLVCVVCTGALLLAAAGMLDGCLATTHWAYKDTVLSLFPGVEVVPDYRRYVRSGKNGKRVTGAGISSGLDEALYIISLLSGVGEARRTQLAMQYHPQPPLHCGDPEDADIKDDPGMVNRTKELWHVADTADFVRSWILSRDRRP